MLDSGYSAAEFGPLHHLRWRVEEAFRCIKHRLRLEAASGPTHLAFQQDFAAKVLADNPHMLLTAAADPQALHAQPTSRTNRTYPLGTLKPILAGCLLTLLPCLRVINQVMAAIAHTRFRI